MAHSKVLGDLTVDSVRRLRSGCYRIHVRVPMASLRSKDARRWLEAVMRRLPEDCKVPTELVLGDEFYANRFAVEASCRDRQTAVEAVETFLNQLCVLAATQIQRDPRWISRLSGKIVDGSDPELARVENGEISPGEARGFAFVH